MATRKIKKPVKRIAKQAVHEKLWSITELEQFEDLQALGKSDDDIAAITGRSVESVRNMRVTLHNAGLHKIAEKRHEMRHTAYIIFGVSIIVLALLLLFAYSVV